MNTFFSTKTTGKSSQGNTCCKLFVTDKVFVYAVPMKSKSEVLQAVKQFSKEIGTPTPSYRMTPVIKPPNHWGSTAPISARPWNIYRKGPLGRTRMNYSSTWSRRRYVKKWKSMTSPLIFGTTVLNVRFESTTGQPRALLVYTGLTPTHHLPSGKRMVLSETLASET